MRRPLEKLPRNDFIIEETETVPLSVKDEFLLTSKEIFSECYCLKNYVSFGYSIHGNKKFDNVYRRNPSADVESVKYRILNSSGSLPKELDYENYFLYVYSTGGSEVKYKFDNSIGRHQEITIEEDKWYFVARKDGNLQISGLNTDHLSLIVPYCVTNQ